MNLLYSAGRLQAARACARSSRLPSPDIACPRALRLPNMTCRLLHHSPGCCRPADSNSKGPHSSIPPSPEVKTKAESTAPPTTSSAPRTHYDIFPETLPQGPPPHGHFPVDVRALRREFLRLQAQAHPDLHPAKDKVRAQSMSALINTAFKTLSNPLLRAQYLLGLRGINPGEDEQARVDDPALLMTVMEAHEQIQEAKMEADLKSLNEENEERIKVSENILEKAFKEDAIQAAVEESVRLRYWVNIRDSIHNWEPGKPGTVQH